MNAAKMGRPPKAEEQRKASSINLRLTAEERREVDAAAERAGVPVSEWVRRVILEAAGRAAEG